MLDTYINECFVALGELEGFIDSQSFDHILISGDFWSKYRSTFGNFLNVTYQSNN